jgi:hypothetical protein
MILCFFLGLSSTLLAKEDEDKPSPMDKLDLTKKIWMNYDIFPTCEDPYAWTLAQQ